MENSSSNFDDEDRRESLHIVNGRFEDSFNSTKGHDSFQNSSGSNNASHNNASSSKIKRRKTKVRFGGTDTSWIRNSSKKLLVDANNNNNNRSVSFARGTMFDVSEKSGDCSSSRRSMGGGSSRVAQMKAKLRGSLKLTGDDTMDASWGGALMEDYSMSDSDSSDDDMGMDASVNFRAKARKEALMFNITYDSVGVEEGNNSEQQFLEDNDMSASGISQSASRQRRGSSSRRRNTGRGSIFVIADQKFGQTRVVQTRLEKAAQKLQRFFRRCLLVLRQYSEERDYLQNEIEDIETRRVEELNDVKQFLQQEKEQFQMELEQEWNSHLLSQEEWDEFKKDQDDTKAAIAKLKEENEQLKKDSKELQHKNKQLSIVDPEREAEIRSLEIKVQKLQIDNSEWDNIRQTFQTSKVNMERKLQVVTEQRKIKRAHRKRMEKTINKIIKLMEERQALENPKLVEKVNKLKAKREKKMKKLKAKTVMEHGQIPSTVMEEDEEDDEGARSRSPMKAILEQQQAPKERRRSSRKQRQEAADDLPDLAGPSVTPIPAAAAASPTTRPKERRRSSKKEAMEDLPDIIEIKAAEASDDDNDSEDERAAAKKKKKKEKKDKKQKDKKKEKKPSQPDDPTLMRIIEAQQKKKEQEKGSSSSRRGSLTGADGKPGALMSIIMG